jgi:hypothetical protein
MSINKNCDNYSICKQLVVNNNLDYCSDCLIYFNKKIEIVKNTDQKQCPICLENDIDIDIHNLEQCSHIICKPCLFDIYFDKSYLNNKPLNQVSYLSEKWIKFINSRRSNKIKFKIINKYIDFEDYCMDELYEDVYIYNTNIYIPKIFKHNIIDLINYQIQLIKYIRLNDKKKHDKIKYIKKCSYCRAESLSIITIVI